MLIVQSQASRPGRMRGRLALEHCRLVWEGHGFQNLGVTPSGGLISTVRHQVAIDLCVMIRPRGGGWPESMLASR
jgi:CutC family